MGYVVAGEIASGPLAELVGELRTSLTRAGFEAAPEGEAPELVLNVVDVERPRPFRRGSRGTFVAAIHVLEAPPPDPLREGYPMLVRALANVSLTFVPGHGVWFTTLERGSYLVPADDGAASLADAVVERLAPLARSRLVIDNEFRTDLEPELWEGDEITRSISEAGRRLDDLGLLPAPFPVEELVSERDLRHIKRLYGIGGLSYGNLSARKDATRFWMSASGVDKSKLDEPGRDILLVSGYDPRNLKIVLSVPPGVEPRRVSVDAIEHWKIYMEHPDVGAILHVHAWLEGIPATEVNFPCGTEELADNVAQLLAAEPDPAHAVIGLRNHGITATGASLEEILDRVAPRLLRQVPMT
ncbi:MAG TPA: class II aldolase/adducin family protein [Gaiellaceae bacterium]|nr:class II aldolase/adducin family protein [Gaiellaceae bacterium]